MKKTINASVAHSSFVFEEDAYTTLSTYLEEIRTHFVSDPNGEEIVEDIESRIAEMLLKSAHAVHTLKDVEGLIAAMGTVHAFDDGVEEPSPHPAPSRSLYRDVDNQILGGVAAGIAAFFGIDAFIIRVLFVISVFFGGVGVAMYILLWLVVPKAQTASQKLAMRGNSVTIHSLRTLAQTSVTKAKRHRGLVSRIFLLPFEIIGATLRFVGPKLKKGLGILFLLTGFSVVLGASIALVVVATNYNAPYVDLSLKEATSLPLLISVGLSGYIALSIPFIFLAFFGAQLARLRYSFHPSIGFGMVGLWTLSVIALFATGTQLAGSYHRYLSTSERFSIRKEIRELPPFTELSATLSNAHVTYEHGEPGIVVAATSRDSATVIAEVTDGILTIERASEDTGCFFFCDGPGHVEITVRTPQLTTITMRGGNLALADIETSSLSITKYGGSITGTLTAATVTVTAYDARIEIAGSAETANLVLEQYSEFYGPQFTLGVATTSLAYPVRATLYVAGTLHIDEYDPALNREGPNQIKVRGPGTVTRAQ